MQRDARQAEQRVAGVDRLRDAVHGPQRRSMAPLAVYGSKVMMNYTRDHTVDEALDYMGVWNAAYIHTQDLPEAMTATREKRAPKFRDLDLRR